MKELKLPDGKTISLNELLYSTLRSACMIQPWADDDHWDLFVNGQSQPLAGNPNIAATLAHTNVPRSGDSGLPKDWSMLAYRWRASSNVPPVQPMLDWASETSVSFLYNQKRYATEKLADLLLGPQLLGQLPDCPIHLRESLSYKAIIYTENRAALIGLRRWLRNDMTDAGIETDSRTRLIWKDCVAELETIATMAANFNSEGMRAVSNQIRNVQNKLMPGRTMTLWLHIEGLIERSVV